MEKIKLTEPAAKVIVERVHFEALASILSTWLGFYPSLKSVTPHIIHALLTDESLSVESYNSFVEILLGRHQGSKYRSPGEGGIFVDDGQRVVWFASHMSGREVQVRQTKYGWRADFLFGDGSISTASRVFAAASDDGYGYAVAYNGDDAVVAQSNFLLSAPAPREGWAWLPFHLAEESGYLIEYLGDRLPEVSKAVANALLERALLDQDAALAALARAANE